MKQDKLISTKQFPRLAYTVRGEGSVLVLLHGFPLDRTIWNDVAEHLAGSFKVITPDMPGAGLSTFSSEDLTIDDMAASVNAILKEEDVDKAVIAGHSMGGYVAVAYAEQYPDCIAGLGMIHSSAQADSIEKKEQRQKSINIFEKGGGSHFVKQMLPNLFSEENSVNDYVSKVVERALLTSGKSLSAFYKAMMNRTERISILRNNSLPVLWVLGNNDKVLPVKDLTQQTSLANVNFVYNYQNCGHMSMIEAPSSLVEDMALFVRYCNS